LLMTDVLTTLVEIIFRVKWIVFLRRWCYKSGPLKVIGQFRDDGISCKTCVKFVLSHWLVLIHLFLATSVWGPSIVSQTKLVC